MEVKQETHIKYQYRGLNPRFPKLPKGLLSVVKK